MEQHGQHVSARVCAPTTTLSQTLRRRPGQRVFLHCLNGVPSRTAQLVVDARRGARKTRPVG